MEAALSAPRSFSHQLEWSGALGSFHGDHETRLISAASRCLARVPVTVALNNVLFGDRAQRDMFV